MSEDKRFEAFSPLELTVLHKALNDYTRNKTMSTLSRECASELRFGAVSALPGRVLTVPPVARKPANVGQFKARG